jgi:hypothetical protein
VVACEPYCSVGQILREGNTFVDRERDSLTPWHFHLKFSAGSSNLLSSRPASFLTLLPLTPQPNIKHFTEPVTT